MRNTRSSRPGLWSRAIASPWLWGAASTWGFYQLLPHLPVGKDLATRYCSSHPLEYVLCALFFTGLSIIAIKGVMMIFERRAFNRVPDFGVENPTSELSEGVSALKSRVGWSADVLRHTYWGRRLDHLLTFFQGRNSTAGLNDHLSYLSDADADRLQSSHALLQTVIWSIPILGFLGTVMGITLAIANVTPDQLDSSLDDVTGGLAVAFDTTALALSLSLVLGFTSLFVKRAEERLLADIDERCRLEVHRCFPLEGGSGSLIHAEERAAEALIHQTAELIDRQTKLWSETLTGVRRQWSETLDEQRAHLARSIQSGAESTLTDHAELLARLRRDFLSAQEEIGRRVAEQLDQVEDRRQRAQHEMVEKLTGLAARFEHSAGAQVERQNEELTRILDRFSERVDAWQTTAGGWQEQMQDLTEAMTRQSRTLLEHGEQLSRVVSQEESLLRLQDNLNRNLEAVRNAETFDETLHSLSAAVHLLTTRARSRDAA